MAVLTDRQPGSCAIHRLLVAVMVALPLSVANAQGYNETEVKAAFLYHFTSYIEYPSGAFAGNSTPFVIGVLGKSGITDALQQAVKGKSVRGRAIVVKQVSIGQELLECHILFVPDAEAKSLPRILEILGDAPVLLVGESENFAAKGGMVGFFVEQKRVRFEVNLEAARRAHLTISSKLLSLARIVRAKGRD
jgi:hypothetical protein